MSRRRQSGSEVEITLDRRFLFVFVGGLALVLALGLGVLVGQFRSGSFSPAAAQPAGQNQLQQPVSPQSGRALPQVQSDGQVQVAPQQPVPSGQGDTLTEEDATGLVAGDVMQDPCFVINLLEFQNNVVKYDYRLTKKASINEPHPQLAVEGLNSRCGNAFDFGQLERTEVGQHTFNLKNAGDEPLTVTGLYTSCGCTIAQVEGHEVGANGVLSPPLELEPGQTKEFLVALDAKRVENSNEPRIIQIFSDDPRGVPFGELWPHPGKDKELRFAILAQVGGGGGEAGQLTPESDTQ